MKLVQKAGFAWAAFFCALFSLQSRADTIKFSGYEWETRTAEKQGPGPNEWNSKNAFVDAEGRLHLRISRQADHWSCAEITSKKLFGCGSYQFQVIGGIDRLDKNTVLGLFNYPASNSDPDTTNEIDIEFSHWGNDTYPIGNYTTWPAKPGFKQTSKTFDFNLKNDKTTHRFLWKRDSIQYQSLAGFRDDNKNEFASFLFKPINPLDLIPQKPEPVHLNLWLFQGQAPSDGKEVEIIVKSFKFAPK